jgi:hypothetical protein
MLNFFFTAAAPVLINDKPYTVDFSLLDTIAGAASGVVATALVFVTIGYFLKKFEIVTFSKAEVKIQAQKFDCENCLDHRAEHERSITNQAHIDSLYSKFNDMRIQMSQVITDVAVIKEGNSMILSLLRSELRTKQ